MINFGRIFKDYRESGALHELVGIQSAIGEGVFATKGGDLVMFMRLAGIDYECLDPQQTDAIARRLESCLPIFDERFRIYQYILKRGNPAIPSEPRLHPVVEEARLNRLDYLQSKAQTLYSLENYAAVVYEGWQPQRGFKNRLARWMLNPHRAWHESLSTGAAVNGLRQELEIARDLLVNKMASFAVQLRDSAHCEILDSQGGFGFLRRLLNYAPCKVEGVRLNHDSFIDFQACGSSVECHREFLRVDDDYAQVLTLKDPPARTFAHMLRELAEIPSNAVLVTEWRRETNARIRQIIQSKRRHFHNVKTSLATQLNAGPSNAARDVLVDDGAVALVADLGAGLEAIEVQGRYFGEFSATIVLYDADLAALRRSVAQCLKIFATHDAQLTEERYNRLNAWLAVLPGNAAFNLRKMWLSNNNYVDLSFPFTLKNGEVRNEHLGAEYLAVLEGSGGTPYFFNLHYKDIAHTLILGATGSGKSFLLNFLLTHLQKYAPETTIFDLGGSYEWLTKLFDGSYLAIGAATRGFTINPFCLPPTPDNLLFLFSFVRVLIEAGGYSLNADDEKDLYEQIENLYAVEPDQRRLLTLANIVRRPLRGRLQKWVQGGPYGSYFDNPRDTLTLSHFQTFDFAGMDQADVLEPLLFYILHRASARLDDLGPAVFKVFVVDEAWRFFENPVIKNYIVEALKTWRKKNAAMLLATQSAEDLMHSAMLPVVAESCPTRLFLANPGMDQGAYRRAFGLNETEVERIAALVPKRQILIKQPDMAKLVQLNVDRKGYWLYTNNPPDNERRREAFARHGFRQGLEILAKENP
jgi:type IV secretion/conjugal transfer VirB4 family ATPase